MHMEHRLKRHSQKIGVFLRSEIPTFIFSTIGIFIYALGVVAFTLHYTFPDAGVMGISILAKYALGLSPSIVNVVLNVLIFAWGGRELNKRFIIYSLYNVFALSFFLGLLDNMSFPVINDMFLVSVAGGIVKGLGLGIMFRTGSSSGGLDIIAAVMRKRYGVDVGRYCFFANIFIIGASFPVVGLEKVLFGYVASFISGQTLDGVLASFDKRRLVFIVTRPEEKGAVVNYISTALGRGATVFKSEGGFTKEERCTIMCLLNPRQVVTLKRYLSKCFPRTFMTVSEASEVLGNGFKHWRTVSKQ